MDIDIPKCAVGGKYRFRATLSYQQYAVYFLIIITRG